MEKLINNSDQQLSSLIHKAQHLDRLNQLLRKFLDPLLKEHCRVANYRENILILEIDNAAWNMRLRFQLTQLTAQLRQSGMPQLSRIESYIRPAIDTYQLL